MDIITDDWPEFLEAWVIKDNKDGSYNVIACDKRKSYDEGEIIEVKYRPSIKEVS